MLIIFFDESLDIFEKSALLANAILFEFISFLYQEIFFISLFVSKFTFSFEIIFPFSETRKIFFINSSLFSLTFIMSFKFLKSVLSSIIF